MAVRQKGLMNNFDAYKKQGLSDTEAMEKAIKASSEETAKANATEKKVKKEKEKKLLSKVTKNLKSVFGPGHSKAGRRYLAGKVKKK